MSLLRVRSVLLPAAFGLFALSAGAAAAVPSVPPPHSAAAAAPQDASGFGPLDPAPPSGGVTPEQIIQRFAAKETEFATALNDYTFRRTVRVNTISDDTGKPDGEYQDVTDIVLSQSGARAEHVVFAPQNTLQRVMMSQADFDDIEHRLPFILTTADLPQYDITYLGRQKVDDLNTYVFEAGPKRIEKNHRYFQGKVWVDQQDLQIVLVNGKSVPDDTRRGHEDLSPPYTTYYSEVDGHYWFPIYTHADGVLHFAAQTGAAAQDVRIKYTVKYTDYKRFRAKSRIIYNGETLPAAAPDGSGQPQSTAPSADEKAKDPAAQPAADPDAPALKRPK